MKFLFGIGVEKCGTTAVNAALARSPRFNTPRNKETFYFSHHYARGTAYYESLYPRPFAEVDGVNVDITPMYFRRQEALDRMESFPCDHRILLVLRCPLRRAWSAYLQEIRNQVATGNRSNGFARPMDASFSGSFERADPYLFTRYANLVANTRRRFGVERCRVLLFEAMLADWPSEAAGLDSLCGFDSPVAATLPLPHANPAGRVPRIFDHVKETDGSITMAQKIGGTVRVHYGLDETRLDNALRLHDSFEHEVGEALQRAIRDYFADDVARVGQMLDRSLDAWLQPGCLRAEVEPVTASDHRLFRALRRKGAVEMPAPWPARYIKRLAKSRAGTGARVVFRWKFGGRRGPR
ncbi:MAG TPA: hypothetical protein VK973_15950 [Arenicellales bacterium]|nr:hypothetical protein [Arenicellales bacterium]